MSFDALFGEPLRQLRLAVKDLLYQNRHERIAGDLDLLERQLAIATRYGLLAGSEQTRALAVVLAGDTPLARALRQVAVQEIVSPDGATSSASPRRSLPW